MSLLRALVAVLLCLACASGRAEDSAEKARARQLLAQGNAQFEQGDYRGALVLFRQAYDFFPSPKLLVNVAACEKALGRPDQAASDLAEFLRQHERMKNPPAEQRALADRARIDLDVLEPELGRIVVETSAREAIVEIDGAESWRRTYVKPGEHRVTLREEGLPAYEARVRVELGKTVTVGRSAEPPVDARTDPPVRPIVEKPDPAAAHLAARATPGTRPRWVVPVAVIGGVVVLGLGLGLGLGLRHSTQALSGDLGTVSFEPK